MRYFSSPPRWMKKRRKTFSLVLYFRLSSIRLILLMNGKSSASWSVVVYSVFPFWWTGLLVLQFSVPSTGLLVAALDGRTRKSSCNYSISSTHSNGRTTLFHLFSAPLVIETFSYFHILCNSQSCTWTFQWTGQWICHADLTKTAECCFARLCLCSGWLFDCIWWDSTAIPNTLYPGQSCRRRRGVPVLLLAIRWSTHCTSMCPSTPTTHSMTISQLTASPSSIFLFTDRHTHHILYS